MVLEVEWINNWLQQNLYAMPFGTLRIAEPLAIIKTKEYDHKKHLFIGSRNMPIILL